MANEGKDWTLEGLDNPLTIQHMLLDRFEKQTGGVIVDNNNPACVLMESFAQLSSSQLRMMDDNVRPAIYPARAVMMADLLKHLSDYDYVDIFSTPCPATITFVIEKEYVLTHSIPVEGKDYSKMVIPRSTQITLGEHTFGLYYPIEFRTNLKSGRFSVIYQDTDIKGNRAVNPLKTLETNVLDFEFREYNGHKLAYVRIPCFQFAITKFDTTMTTTAGFKTRVPYPNKFYALRCWADVLTNFGHDETEDDVFERRELNLAVSGQTYDPSVPTVIFTPDVENNEVILEVPYIYFTENRIRGVLHADIFTTEGHIDYRVPYNTDTSCVIDMFGNISSDEEELFDATKYAEPFRQMPALNAFSISSHIVGGSDGIDFESLRQKIIRGANTNVLQTPADIDAYFASQGYTATLYRDGITDRIFIVHATVRDTDGVVVGADSISTLFDFSKINDYGTIVKSPDSRSTYTVLPSTIYRFDESKKICVPLTDLERMELDNMSPAEKVAAYNNHVYTLSPFHLQINAASRYPTTITYDMLQVRRVARTHIAARDSQFGLALNTVNLDVYRRDGDVADKYRMTIRVARVGFGNEIPVRETYADSQGEKKIRALVGMKNDDGEYRWAEMAYIGKEEGDEDNADNEVFELLITPNYVFHQANNQHTVQMAFWDNDNYSDFFLRSELRVILLLKDGLALTNDEGSVYRIDGDQALSGGTKFSSGTLVLPTSKAVPINTEAGMNGYFAMLEHKCVFQFGSPVDELDQRINLTYSEAVYQTHKTTKLRTLENDVFKTDDEGNIEIVTDFIPCGDDEVAAKGVVYYEDADGVEQSVVAVGDSVAGKYKKTIGVSKLFSAGDIACMTSKSGELITPNKYTVNSYVGCTLVDGTKLDKTAIDENYIIKLKDMTVVDAPLVPRFEITNGVSGIGKYELINVKNQALSSVRDVWANTSAAKISSSKVRNHLIKTNNALELVLKYLCNETESAANDPDPIGTLAENGTVYKIGTFLLVKNDYTVPKFVQVGTIGDEPDNGVYTRLYYKFRNRTSAEIEYGLPESSTYVCIAQGKTKSDMMDHLSEQAKESDAEATRNPKYYGFAYVLASYTGSYLDPDDDVLETIKYVSFLTNASTTSTVEMFIETEDNEAIYTKEYYLNRDGSFILAGESDFAEDGSFLPENKYYERSAKTETFEVPDFSMVELNAWERRTFFVPMTGDVVEGKDYYYLDPVANANGVTRYALLDDSVDRSTVGTLFVKKEMAEVVQTGKEFGWEQSGNRWPWEMTNWKYVSSSGGSVYLVTDDKFVIDPMHDRLRRYCEFSSGQVILDEDGHPLEDYTKERYIQYLVDILQLDAKLAQVTVQREDERVGSDFGDDGPTSNRYPTTVVTVLRNHFDNVGKARDSMFTNTRLFFEPVKSLGFANFNVGNGELRELPLDVTMKFKLHVTKDVYEDDILLIQLKKQIVEIIDDHIDSNGYVNCVEIANDIKAQMGGTIKYVDILGINGDVDLQTMKSDDKEVRPHLRHVLKLLDDGVTIDSDRGMEIEAVIND